MWCRYQGGPNAGHTIVVGGGDVEASADAERRRLRHPFGDRRRLRRRCTGVRRRSRPAGGARHRPVDRGALGQCASDHAVARHDRSGLRTPSRLAPDRHDRARIGPTYADKASASGSASRTCSTRRSCARRSKLRSPRRTSGWSGYTRWSRSTSSQCGRSTRASRSGWPRSSVMRRCSWTMRSGPASACCSKAQATMLDLDHGAYSVRHLVEPDRLGRSNPGSRNRPYAHRPSARHLQGVRDAGRQGAVPVGDRGRRPGAAARARRRVRHGDRPGAPLRLARPRRVAICRSRQRHDLARTDEARRALRIRRAARLCALPLARRLRDGAFPRTPVRLPPCDGRLGDLAGLVQPLDDASSLDDLPAAARAYVEFVARDLQVPIELVGVGAARERVLA